MSEERRFHRLVVQGRLPGLNEYIAAERTNRQMAAKIKREAQERIGWYIRQQLRGVKFTRPVTMVYTWVEPNRKRDKSNIAFARKFVEDALIQQHVIRDDGWDYIASFADRFDLDKNKPRVEVLIWEAGVDDERGAV